MVVRDNRKPKWIFYPAWVVLSVMSIPIAWVIAGAIISQVEKVLGGTIQVAGQTHITEDFLFGFVLLPVLGLLTGLVQFLLLRRYLPRMGWWIAATVLSWLLLLVVLRLSALFPSTLSIALAGVVIGGSIGLPQWLVLRQRVHRAALWILASVLGWGVALLLTDGAISSQQEVLSVLLLPPAAASIAWWLLLDKLPQRESNGGNTPRNTSREPSAPVGAG